VLVKSSSESKTQVSVLDEQGEVAKSANADRIITLLNDQLK
jgi:hypothetical protein